MEAFSLKSMIKGWFVGNFEPSVLKTNDCEVAVKRYSAGESELSHFHKIATEITVIVSGKVKMNGVEYSDDDVILIMPNESTDFEALSETTTVCVKIPGTSNDKYIN